MQLHFHANQSHFHKNGFALRLALKLRHNGSRKWPIVDKQIKFNHQFHFTCTFAVRLLKLGTPRQ